jgi:hypothetical protein
MKRMKADPMSGVLSDRPDLVAALAVLNELE